jgi:hypothetical protein
MIAQYLLGITCDAAKAWNAIDRIVRQMETVQIVHHGYVEGRGCCALFLVATHVQVSVIRAPISKTMDQPRIAVEGEHDRFVHGKNGVEVAIVQPVGMFARGLQCH